MSKAAGATVRKKTNKITARAQTQRNRIIDAAERCFVEKGFHAASIADISAAADMSTGLLYRYFKNKSDIVRTIIDQCLEDESHEIMNRLETVDDVLLATLGAFDRWCCPGDPQMNAALLLETTAEATRDRQIAAAVRKNNQAIRARFESVVRGNTKLNARSLPPAALRARAMVLQSLLEGLAIRAIREPEFDRNALKSALKLAISALLQR